MICEFMNKWEKTSPAQWNQKQFHFILWEWMKWIVLVVWAMGPKRNTKTKFIWFLMKRGERGAVNLSFWLVIGRKPAAGNQPQRKTSAPRQLSLSLLFLLSLHWKQNIHWREPSSASLQLDCFFSFSSLYWVDLVCCFWVVGYGCWAAKQTNKSTLNQLSL